MFKGNTLDYNQNGKLQGFMKPGGVTKVKPFFASSGNKVAFQ
jgi:hypothetical protein